ncbi:hypothetical protein BC629DRAFT_1441678 [Irpex lacteus]|nr:hypothetical protein BC629DRAFT_1441678 [Irpex lacteus]
MDLLLRALYSSFWLPLLLLLLACLFNLSLHPTCCASTTCSSVPAILTSKVCSSMLRVGTFFASFNLCIPSPGLATKNTTLQTTLSRHAMSAVVNVTEISLSAPLTRSSPGS